MADHQFANDLTAGLLLMQHTGDVSDVSSFFTISDSDEEGDGPEKEVEDNEDLVDEGDVSMSLMVEEHSYSEDDLNEGELSL